MMACHRPALSKAVSQPKLLYQQWGALIEGLARHIARVRRLRRETERELIGYGWIGLLAAQARFEPARGVPFEAFATRRILGAMLDGLRIMSPLPRRLYLELGGGSMSPAEREAALEPIKHLAALTMTSTSKRPDDALLGKGEAKLLHHCIESLPSDERLVVLVLYGFVEGNGAELAEQLGVHPSGVSRRHAKALGRLRCRLLAHG